MDFYPIKFNDICTKMQKELVITRDYERQSIWWCDLLNAKSIDYIYIYRYKERDDEGCIDARSSYLLGRGCLSGSPPFSLCSFSFSFDSFSFS